MLFCWLVVNKSGGDGGGYFTEPKQLQITISDYVLGSLNTALFAELLSAVEQSVKAELELVFHFAKTHLP